MATPQLSRNFPFRYTVRDAINGNDWRKLSGNSLISDNSYKQYSVTFVENHDTEYRSSTAQQDPIRKDTLAANAFLLAMPGTPCVFLTHWLDCKRDIKAMIDVRNAVGIHNQSEYLPYATQQTYYAVGSTGSKGEMLAVVGSGHANYTPNARFVKVLSGYHYAYYMNKSMETAWVDLPSGEYEGKQQATLTAVSNNSEAQLVYTTDGSDPTAQSTKVASGTKIDVEGAMTLKVGLLIGSAVSGILTRVYATPEPMPVAECIVNEGEICAFFEAPSDWQNDISCWAWTDTPSDNFTYATGGWPGVACTLLGVAENGNKVWKWSWDGTKQNNSSATQPAKIIFNNTSSPQTADLPFTNGGYYNKNGLVKVITGIEEVRWQKSAGRSDVWYDLSGRRLNGQPTKKGLYIVNGRKLIK